MKKKEVSVTFIHAIQQLIQGVGLAVVLMLLPRFSVIASQNYQLALFSPHGTEVRDFNDYWAAKTHHKNTSKSPLCLDYGFNTKS